MGTEIITASGFNELSPPQQKAHREKIGVRVQSILSQFWLEADTPDAHRALELEGWCDVLENCSHTEIRNSWATYQKTGPRTQTGKLYKPDAGALYLIIMNGRQKPAAVPSWHSRKETPDEAATRIAEEKSGDADRKAMAKRVLKAAGVKVNKLGRVVRL